MSKHDKTLDAIFELPSRSDLRWAAFVSMVESRGGKVTPGAGSRFRFEYGDVRAVIHRPHPGEQMTKAQTKSARDFLDAAGIRPVPPTPPVTKQGHSHPPKGGK